MNEKPLIPVPVLRALTLVWVSALILMCLLTAVTYVQMRVVAPLESPALALTLEKIEKTPGDGELRQQFRALDLLARRAYFTSREQVRTGGVLTVVFFLLFIVTARYHRYLTAGLQVPQGAPGREDDPASARMSVFRVTGWVAGGAALAALLFAVLMDRSWTVPLRGNGSGGAVDDVPHARVWQNFRGPGGLGVARIQDAPAAWDGKTGENIVWKTKVPRPGFSSPVIWGDRIFLTGADETVREVLCFGFADGALQWQQTVPDTFDEVRGMDLPSDAGFAAPTPVVDDKHVWAMFGTGMLACFTHAGEPVWVAYLGAPDNRYGHSSSLMLLNGLLYVQYDHDAAANLFAFRARTGEKMWEQPREEITWSSPVLVPTPRGAAVVTTAVPSIDAYDAATGALLWSLPKVLRGEVGPSAAYAGGLVVVANEYAVAAGIRVTDGTQAEIVWKNDDNLPSTSSPAATDEYVFLAGAEGYVTCHDAADGKTLWEHEFDEGFYASPIIVGDRVYLPDRDGVTHIFACAAEYREIGSPALGEKVNATPAFVKGSIVMRGSKHLYRIGK